MSSGNRCVNAVRHQNLALCDASRVWHEGSIGVAAVENLEHSGQPHRPSPRGRREVSQKVIADELRDSSWQ